MVVLDTSALVAGMYREPGQDRVKAVVRDSLMSTVNLAEVLAVFMRDGFDRESTLAAVASLGIEFVPFSRSQAELSASLFVATRRLGLSLGDRACLALAIERGVPVMTADRAWADLDIGVTVTVIR